MLVTKTSPLTGEKNTMEIDVTQEQLDLWNNGMLIQEAMPHLSSDEREFILSGYTPEDWDQMYGDVDDYEPDYDDDMFDWDGDALASAGWGTDEDYGG